MSEFVKDIKAELKAVMLSCSVQENNFSRLYGKHECQLSEGGEDDLTTHVERCTKRERHTEFIPVKDFKIEHLPERYRDNDLLEWIKAEADITVRICVEVVSPNRPEFYPGTKDPYPFFNKRKSNSFRTGTGNLNVLKYVNGYGYNVKDDCRDKIGLDYKRQNEFCPCEKCESSETPSKIWWEIIVTTATHVVFDKIEADKTSIRWAFDEPNCKKQLLENFSVYHADIENDWCKLKHVTCDAKIGNMFYTKVKHEDILKDEVRKRYKCVAGVNLIFIVSHPHGCSKQISIGESKEIIRHLTPSGKFSKDFKMVKIHYSTPTCPGSSGARVVCLASDNSHVHGGTFDLQTNYSSFGPYRDEQLPLP